MKTTETNMNGAIPFMAKRWIGIRPRVKMTAKGEPHPTEVFILTESGEALSYELKTEQDEFDFVVAGKWPVNGKFRDVCDGEDLSVFLKHHIIKDNPKDATKKQRALKPDQVPVAYDGLHEGDLCGLSLGGLGDILALSMHRRGKRRGFRVLQITSFGLKEKRGDASKNNDAKFLATLLQKEQGLFREVTDADREFIEARIAALDRLNVMGQRLVATQQNRSATQYQIFCTEEGECEDMDLAKRYKQAEASDEVLLALNAKEADHKRVCEKACKRIPLYADCLTHQKAVGPLTSVVIMGIIGDIGRFRTVGKFKKYCGVHVNADGTFPRQRRGERSNWNRKLRQAFWNLGESFNKFPDSFWGSRLLENKVMYRGRYPHTVLREISGYRQEGVNRIPEFTGREIALVPGTFKKKKGEEGSDEETYEVTVDGKTEVVKGIQKYTPAHIHRKGAQRTITEFAEWLYWKWRTMEGYIAPKPKVSPPEDDGELVPTGIVTPSKDASGLDEGSGVAQWKTESEGVLV